MFNGLALPALLAIFTAGAVAVWIAGIVLADATDLLAERLGLGQALGGLILLAVATNLPEIAITVSAALAHDLSIATSNILGGIAIQTVVLVILDAAMRVRAPLTSQPSSPAPALEGMLVIGVLLVAIMGHQLPSSLARGGLSADAVAIAALWLGGLWLLKRAGGGLPWRPVDRAAAASTRAAPAADAGSAAPGTGDHPEGTRRPAGRAAMSAGSAERGDHPAGGGADRNRLAHWGTTPIALLFAVAALVTLAAGVVLESSGSGVAGKVGLSGAFFGATVLAATTALPEVATGLTAVRLGSYDLAIGDIFGGNAFLPVLFLPAGLLSGRAVLPHAAPSDIYLAALGALLTAIYICGLLFRPARLLLRVGLDSLTVLIVYAVGVVGLIAIS